ncbi:MAG: GNAT family N-acetyltransferase [Deltaproteobacteria bacterium]|nr:GNAT family N-acetyltransferase [Deltaproteobacteria bacterium]
MPTIKLAPTPEDHRLCFPVMKQLRPHLTEDEFVERVGRQAREGYLLAYLEDEGEVRGVAGFRIFECLHQGRFLYVDDLVTDERSRSRGYGDKLFDWLAAKARADGCEALTLDSGVQRHDAHRFYLRKRMRIASYHFSLPLS